MSDPKGRLATLPQQFRRDDTFQSLIRSTQSHLDGRWNGRDRTGIIPTLYGDRQRLPTGLDPRGVDGIEPFWVNRTSEHESRLILDSVVQPFTRCCDRRKCILITMLLTTTCDSAMAYVVAGSLCSNLYSPSSLRREKPQRTIMVTSH